jgi:fatty acid desaturase
MPHYLDETQRQEIASASASWRSRSEWPTWILTGVIYGGWFGVALNAHRLGLPVALPLLAVLSAWYMSLQHELLHGHPTRITRLNALLGAAPLAVWFPYGVYRRTHLQHHCDHDLTRPWADPESFFIGEHAWTATGRVMRTLMTFRNTFVGRILIGPAFAIAATLGDAVHRIRAGDTRDAWSWLLHIAALVVLLAWLDRRCGISPVLFLSCASYPALSISAIRSFHEHRVAVDPAQRSVINEAAWPWRLLFLNNNFHAVHHDLPGVPWFELGFVYARRRSDYHVRNGGYVVHGYGEWLNRFAWRPVAPVAHPLYGDWVDEAGKRQQPVARRTADVQPDAGDRGRLARVAETA